MLVNTPTGPQSTRANVLQTNLSGIYSIGPSFLANSQSLIGELTYVHAGSISELDGSTTLANSRNALAMEIAWTLSYKNVFNGWDLDVPLTYTHDLTARRRSPARSAR